MTSPVSAVEAIEKAMEDVTNKVTWSVEGYDEDTGQMNVVGDGFFIAGVIANQPDQEATAAYIAACSPDRMREVLDELYSLRKAISKDAREFMQSLVDDASRYSVLRKEAARQAEGLQRENAELRESLSETLELAERQWANPEELSEIRRARALLGGSENAE